MSGAWLPKPFYWLKHLGIKRFLHIFIIICDPCTIKIIVAYPAPMALEVIDKHVGGGWISIQSGRISIQNGDAN